jgi:hypothetical protein
LELLKNKSGVQMSDSEDWIISQLVYSKENRKRLLESEDCDHLRNGKKLTDLPLDVLALVLSYFSLKHVLYYMLLSKKCYEAITTRKHFWNRHVLERLKRIIPNQKIIDSYLEYRWIGSLRENYEYLFRKEWFTFLKGKRIDQYENECFIIERATNLSRCLIYIDYKTFKMLSVIIYYNDNDDVEDFKICPEKFGFLKYMKKNSYRVVKAKFEFEDNSTWEGDVKIERGKYYPHGQGIWEYKGLVVSNLAYESKPVYDIKPEEYLKIKGWVNV